MKKLGIIGLGYVGLPLAVEFGKVRSTLGFDINESRIKELLENYDSTKECSKNEIKSAKKLSQDEINKITDELSINFKSKIKLNYNHDQSLIGGLVVQVGSIMIDTSIKNKLQQIENTMIEA